jgi:HK97 family phage major capsid protein
MAGTMLTKAMPADTANTTTPPADTTTPEDLRAELLRAVQEARNLTDTALAAERELTDQERQHVESLLARADTLKARITRAKASAHFREITGELGQLFAADDLPSSGPATKGRGAAWGKAVVRQSSDQFGRFKGLTPSGSVLVDVPAPEPVALGRPVTSVRSLLPNEPTSGVYAFLRQTLRTNNAAPVAPGAVKPTSPSNFERVQDHARVIAHLTEPIPRQDLSDAPLLSAFVTQEMFFGLQQSLEAEILNGDGTGEHFTGLAHTVGIQTVPLGADPSTYDLIVTLRRAITRLEVNGLEGSGWVLNPSDWENVETWSTTEGALVLQGAGQTVPIDRAARRLWGIPVVSTPSCPVGVAWLADWTGSTKLYVREEARLDWSENTWDPNALGAGQGASDFQRNLVRFRAEGRFGFAVTRPSGVVRVALA